MAVGDMLDALVAGQTSLQETARLFRSYPWAPVTELDELQRWGVADAAMPGPDSFGIVQRDSRLTPAQFAVLRQAWQDSLS
jgi:hypothetical protein